MRAALLAGLLALGFAPALAPASPAQEWRDQEAVNAAIERGVRCLLRSQNRDGSWGGLPVRRENHFDQRNDQTALCLYTLLACGLGPDHPAVVRAENYLLQGFPTRTYAISCQLMALAALGKKEHADRMEDMLDALLDCRETKSKGWGYPGHGSVLSDLSNTQYGALGLRAALQVGLKVPDKEWLQLIDALAAHQDKIEGGGEGERAGFCYAPPHKGSGGDHASTASMTAAGIAVLELCREGLGPRITRPVARRIDSMHAPAMAWLVDHFAVDSNPGGPAQWKLYYLYGLERVGSLLGIDRIGEHDWYWEGAQHLIKSQAEDGSWSVAGDTVWPPAPLPDGNTAFALLFLTRATARKAASGAGARVRADLYASEDPGDDVWVRASGRSKLAVWVSGFSSRVLSKFVFDEELRKGLRVSKVEYVIDGEVVETVLADAEEAWRDERFAIQHRFERAGSHSVEVLVEVLRPAPDAGESPTALLRSGVLDVFVDDVLEDWMLRYPKEAQENLLSGARVKARATSELSPQYRPNEAVDGLQFTAWICSKEDAEPKLTLELSKPVRARYVAISPAAASSARRKDFAALTRVEVWINKEREPHVVEIDGSSLEKTVLELPKSLRIQRVVIGLAGRGTDSDKNGSATGIAEVELFARRGR